MSAILPTVMTCRPAALARSRIVGAGGGIARSRRLAVRLKSLAVEPMNGRAITRPMRSGSTSSRVRCDLEHAVGGCVTDRFSSGDVLLSERGDDIGAGGVAVSEYARKARAAAERVGELDGEAGAGAREIAPVAQHRHAGDLPMAGRSVLSLRNFCGAAIGCLGRAVQFQARRAAPGRQPRRLAQAKPDQIGHGQRTGARAVDVRSAPGACLSDVAEGVSAFIAISGRIGGAPTDGIQNQQECARHLDLPKARAENETGRVPQPEIASRLASAPIGGGISLRSAATSPARDAAAPRRYGCERQPARLQRYRGSGLQPSGSGGFSPGHGRNRVRQTVAPTLPSATRRK